MGHPPRGRHSHLDVRTTLILVCACCLTRPVLGNMFTVISPAVPTRHPITRPHLAIPSLPTIPQMRKSSILNPRSTSTTQSALLSLRQATDTVVVQRLFFFRLCVIVISLHFRCTTTVSCAVDIAIYTAHCTFQGFLFFLLYWMAMLALSVCATLVFKNTLICYLSSLAP